MYSAWPSDHLQLLVPGTTPNTTLSLQLLMDKAAVTLLLTLWYDAYTFPHHNTQMLHLIPCYYHCYYSPALGLSKLQTQAAMNPPQPPFTVTRCCSGKASTEIRSKVESRRKRKAGGAVLRFGFISHYPTLI